MGKNKHRNRLPEKQSTVLMDFNPRTDKQQELVDSILTKEITIVTGTSGAGKTYVTLATALNLLERGYKKIILVKSVTKIPGEDIGFTPGDAMEKMAPYMMSFTWNIDKLCGKDASKDLLAKGLLEVIPLAYIRGISIDDAIVIVDEAQNINKHTFKTVMTRIGENSKYIFLGDVEQVDRRKVEESCLDTVVEIFRDVKYVGVVEFADEDCVRNPIIPNILEELRHYSI